MSEKEKVISTATQLFLKYGVKSVSMDDISRELGISKKTLYEYVENKQDLVRKVVNDHLQCQKQIFSDIHEEANDAVDEMIRITNYILNLFENMSDATLYDLKKYYRKVWDEWDDFHSAHVYEVISTNLKNGTEEGLYRAEINPDIIARLYVVKVSAIKDDDMLPRDRFKKHEILIQALHYHMRGILSEKGMKLFEKYLKKNQEA